MGTFELTKCLVEGHYLKFYEQVTEYAFKTKCDRCHRIVHITDKMFYKRRNGEYKL